VQGSIKKRGKDSWAVVVSAGYDPLTGKRVRHHRTIRGRRTDAEALLVQMLSQRDTGIDSPPGKLTTAQYLRRWLRDYAEPNCRPKTFARYEQYVRLHWIPALGSVTLGKLRPLHIQEVYVRMQGNGLSAQTVLHAHRVLRTALQQAIRWQLLARNPADAAQPPRPVRYRPPMLSENQVQDILNSADETPYGTLVYLALMTGMREGELLGLRWQDIDTDSIPPVLRVRQTCGWLSGKGYFFGEPKTVRSARVVELDGGTITRLRQHRAVQAAERLYHGSDWTNHDLVFTGTKGRPIYPGTLRANWLGIVRQAGLDHLRFHDLRHAHASLLLASGEHPKVVQERLGHSSISTTMDIYSHVASGIQAGAAERLAARLRRTG